MTYPDELAEQQHAIWKARFCGEGVTDILAGHFAKNVVDMEKELDQLRHGAQVSISVEEEIVDLGIKAPSENAQPVHGLIDAYREIKKAATQALEALLGPEEPRNDPLADCGEPTKRRVEHFLTVAQYEKHPVFADGGAGDDGNLHAEDASRLLRATSALSVALKTE